MASYNPPTENLPIFDNQVFDSVNGSTILTVSIANLLYLRKTFPDTCTALETFNAGIAVNTIQPTATTTTMLINSTMTSGDLYIGANTTGTNLRTGIIHIGDSNSIASGGAVHINNGTSNTSSTQVMNGATTSGNLNLMSGATCSGIINMVNGNSNTSTVNILTGQNCTGQLNIGTATVGTNTVPVNINTGNQSGTVTIGNSSNAVQINSATVNIRSTASTTATINIANIGGTAIAPTNGSVNIANGSENPTFAGYTTQVNISTGKNSGQITLGNADNATVLNSSTISIGNTNSSNSYMYIGNGNGVTNDIQIASGTAGIGSNASTVAISAGATTGLLTLGNANNSISLNGAVTLSKPLILGSTPTLNTQLGFNLLTPGTSTSLGAATGATTTIVTSSASIPIGTYMIHYAARYNTSGTTTVTTIQCGLTLNAGDFYASTAQVGSFTIASGVNNIGLSSCWVGKITTSQTILLKTYIQYTGTEPTTTTTGQGTYISIVRIA